MNCGELHYLAWQLAATVTPYRHYEHHLVSITQSVVAEKSAACLMVTILLLGRYNWVKVTELNHRRLGVARSTRHFSLDVSLRDGKKYVQRYVVIMPRSISLNTYAFLICYMHLELRSKIYYNGLIKVKVPNHYKNRDHIIITENLSRFFLIQ